MPRVHLEFSTDPTVILLLVAVAAGTAFLFYRSTLPPVPRPTRVILTVLRAATFASLLLLPFQPAVHLEFTSSRKPGLAILVDNSRSMTIVDRTGDRAATLRWILTGKPLGEIGDRAGLAYYSFGTHLKAVPDPARDSLPLDENGTDISGALGSLADEKQHSAIDAVLLLTDGSYNLGENPVYAAEKLAVPFYCVGIGDSAEQKDVVVTTIAANDVVYAGTKTPVDVTIKSSGFNGERVEVTLSEGTRELDRAHLVLSAGTAEYPVKLTYTPEGEGRKTYAVRVSTLPGELTAANNRRTFSAKVLKSKLHIAIIAGSPGTDLTVIRETLIEQKNFDVRSFTQRIPSGFYEGRLSGIELDSADCIVLIGMPTSATPGSTLELLQESLVQRGKPFLYVNGPSVDFSRLSSLEPVVPFTAPASSRTEELVSVRPSDLEKQNPLLVLEPSQSTEPWMHLPPIFRTRTALRAKPEAVTLAFASIQGVPATEPLILTRNVNGEKSLAIVGYGVWRWRLMAQDDPETAPLFATFLSNSIRWLTTPEEGKPVKVTTSRASYNEGERVDFIGQVRNASAMPVDNARVRVTVKREGGATETDLLPIGDGRYEGSLEGLVEGDYTFHADAQVNNTPIGEDNGRFTIGGMNLEYLDTRMNADLLRQIAQRTGGRAVTAFGLQTLDSLLVREPWLSPQRIQQSRDIELWHWHFLLGALVILLAAEWFLRKRYGML